MMLAVSFLDEFAREYDRPLRGITPDAQALLRAYHYPGNVRELRNLVERAVALCRDDVLTAADLPSHLQAAPATISAVLPSKQFPEDGFDLDSELARLEKTWLLAALDEADGQKTRAAQLLHMSFRSFRYRLHKYALDD